MLSNLSQYSQFPGLQAGGFPQMSQGFGLYLACHRLLLDSAWGRH